MQIRTRRALGPHDVAVAGRVSVALAVADEHHGPAGGLVGEDAVALAGPAHEARRVAVRESRSTRAGPSNVVRAVTTGSSPTPSASSAGSMKKPNPSETISIGIPAACARRTNGTNPGSCGWAAAVASSAAAGASISDISSSISRREPIRPAS